MGHSQLLVKRFQCWEVLIYSYNQEKGGQLPEPQTCPGTHFLPLLQDVVFHGPSTLSGVVVPAAWMRPLGASGGQGHGGPV